MRCKAITKNGTPCTQTALTDAQLCASHSGRCGARPGNRNALRHGLYSRYLTPEERLDLFAARATQGLREEIAVTRLMILRALRQQDSPAEAYARLADVLCRQLRTQRQLNGKSADRFADALAALFDEAATALGLDAA
jgi:hypothetical protein